MPFIKRYIVIAVMTLFCFSALSIAEDLPTHVLINYETLGANQDDSMEVIERSYKKKVKEFKGATRNGNVISIKPDFDQIKKLDTAFSNIKTFHRNNPDFNKPPRYEYQSFSDNWIKHVEPTNVDEYYDAVWKATEPKVSAAFKSAPAQMDYGFDDGMRINPKLMNQNNHYIGYGQIKQQAFQIKSSLKTIEQVDLYREVLLLQIHSKVQFDKILIDRMLSLSSKDSQEFLKLSLEMLLENKDKFTSNNKLLNSRALEREFKKLLSMASSKKIKSLLTTAKDVHSHMNILRNSIIFNETTQYLYDYFIERNYYLRRIGKNEFQDQAWKKVVQMSKTVQGTKDRSFSLIFSGLYAGTIKNIKTKKDLGFFDTVLWRHVGLVRNLVSNDIVDMDYKDIEKLQELDKKLKLKFSFVGNLDFIDQSKIKDIAGSESVEFITESVDELLLKACKSKVKSLL